MITFLFGARYYSSMYFYFGFYSSNIQPNKMRWFLESLYSLAKMT